MGNHILCIIVQIKSAGGGGNAAMDKTNMDRGDLSKIVITRNRVSIIYINCIFASCYFRT